MRSLPGGCRRKSDVVGTDPIKLKDAVGGCNPLARLADQIVAVGGLAADLLEVAAVDQQHDSCVALLPAHAAPA